MGEMDHHDLVHMYLSFYETLKHTFERLHLWFPFVQLGWGMMGLFVFKRRRIPFIESLGKQKTHFKILEKENVC
jgi:hypothetical protein